MSQHNSGLGNFVNRLAAMFKGKSQRKNARSSVTLSEMLETRQLLAADLQKLLYDTTMLDNANGGNQTTDSYFVAFNEPKDVQQLKSATGAVSVEPFNLIPNSYTFTFNSAITFQAAADKFDALNKLGYVYPNVPLDRTLLAIPNDSLFPNQWYLRNTGQTGGITGQDANVTTAWNQYTGKGVVVGVVDNGIDISHPDLLANLANGSHIDLVGNDADPTPGGTTAADAHGTGIAGVIGAVGNNNIGIAGTAYDASIAGIRLVGSNQTTSATAEAQALSHLPQTISVYNNSWGPTDNGRIAAMPPQVVAALQAGTINGRGGLGSIYTFAAGNGGGQGDYSNYSGYASSRFVIAVGAVNDVGQQAGYSESGANLLISAPSSPGNVYTTDLRGKDGANADPAQVGQPDPDGDLTNPDYTSRFLNSQVASGVAGTSVSAGIVSGVVAMMLEANPNLSYRDVMDILVRTARKNNPSDFGWTQNGAGLWVNHRYGFGVVDATAAVAAAQTHATLGTLRSETTGLVPVNLLIPDFTFNGVDVPITTTSQLSLEHVELVINATHQNRGNLQVTLISPDGTRSTMARTRTTDNGFGYANWTFTSTRHWGEKSVGTWHVQVADLSNGITGTLDSVQLNFYGTDLPIVVTASPSTFAENAGNGASTGTVTRSANSNLSVPLVVTLTSSDTTEATVPLTVTIPAGRRTATFSINAIDDTLLDGTQNARITATIPGYSTSVDLTVLDREEVSIAINPTAINENDGPNAATVTVTRSNTDTSAPAPIVAVNNQLRRYSATGTLLSTVNIPWPTGQRPAGENAHDVAIMESGLIAVYNGTLQAFLSVYNPGTNTWNHISIQDLSASSTDRSNGGLTTSGNFVFLSDMEDSSGNLYGLVRVNVVTGEVQRFGTKSFGNRLFANTWPEGDIYELNPADGSVIRQFNSPATAGGDAGMAFDGKNIWYMTAGTDSIYKIDADTGVLLDTHVVTLTNHSGFGGLAWLNDRLYLLDPFITNDVIVYNPATRLVESIIPVDTVNAITYGLDLSLSGGLAANPNRNSLYVSSTFSDRIYEIDAKTGVILTNGAGSIRAFDTGEYWDGGLAVLGDELYVSAYAGNANQIRVLSLDGAFKRTVPQPFFFGLYSLGGDGIPGLVNTKLRYRDTNLGLDGKLYALDKAGTTVGVFDPNTLDALNFLDLDAPVKTIAVNADGKIYGGDDAGNVREFDKTGHLLRSVPTGLGVLEDIEINVSGRILISSVVGEVAETTTALSSFVAFSTVASDAFVSFGEHVSRNTAELKVTITNPDPTEVSVPLTIVIPEGLQSVTFPLDAVDDNFRDGLQLVTLTASATGYQSASDSVGVVDVEGIAIDVLSTTVKESQGNAATRVKVSRTDVDGPYTSSSVQNFTNPNGLDLLDNGKSTSVISVPSQVSWITDVDVAVNFTHNWVGDLDVYLVSPKGTRVELFTDLNTNSKNMTNTVLDDQAKESINAGKDSFTGHFMPEESFLKLYHEQSAGDWTLEVTDDNVGDLGRLLSWSLTLYTEGLSAANVVLQTSAVDEAGFKTLVSIPVVIPPNQKDVFVDLDAVDDNILDGSQVVTVSAATVDIPEFFLGSDQVIVTDDEKLTFSVSRTSVSEAAGVAALTGTLTRFNSDISTPFVVSLLSSDTSELTVPATVTIPANQTSVTFPINAIDDQLIDGTQIVTITASAPAYGGDLTAQVSVEDLEPSLVLSASSTSVREDSGTLEVTVTRVDQPNLNQAMVVNLSSVNVPTGGNLTITVPATVTIPANSASATFFVTVVDDALLDGTQIAKITASSNGLISGDIQINVTDVETVNVSINKLQFLENAGAKAAIGTVTRSNTNVTQPLIVSLQSSDTTELTVPATVTIPAGQTSITFDIAAINDPILDGPQNVQITSSAVGYFGTSATVTVADHEPPVVTGPSASTVNPLPTINWLPIPGAIRYDVQVSNLSTGVPLLIFKTVTGTSLTPVEKLGIGRYRVWVRAVDSLERPGFWSEPKDFKVETAPTITAPSLKGTIANTTFPEIAWTAVADAARYELWVNNLTTGKVRVISRTDLTTTSYKSTEGLGSGTYNAFVRAFNASSEFGQWSAGYTFTVLATPTIIQPTTGGTFDRTPTFTWNTINGAANYDLWVSNRTLGTVAIRNQNIKATSFTPPKDMAAGDYTVWVRAQYGQYFSPWSAARQFSVGMPPVISTPTNGTTAPARPTFLWSSISDTERYELWVTNVKTNTRPIYLTNLTSTSYTPTSNLAAGSYRVWVRAVSKMGETTLWSTAVDFTVASVEAPSNELPNGSSDALLTSLLAGDQPKEKRVVAPQQNEQPVAVATQAGAPKVVQMPVVSRTSFAVASESEVMAFDAVMESWDASDWWAPATSDASSKAVSAQVAERTSSKKSQQNH